jgi:predicted kinase
LRPTVVAVGGVIASGKSAIASRLSAELSAPVIETDRTRKSVLGVNALRPLDEPAWSGSYSPAFSDRVYDELFRRAGVVLASGRPVVLDASFRSAPLRSMARDLAKAHGVPFRFIECRATPDVCRERLAERARQRTVSDGRLAIFDEFCARYEPVVELGAGEHMVLDTTKPIEDSVETLRKSLETWPQGLVG